MSRSSIQTTSRRRRAFRGFNRTELWAERRSTRNGGRRIREEFDNGRDYYALHGRPLTVLPSSDHSRPAREFLEWHNGIFKG